MAGHEIIDIVDPDGRVIASIPREQAERDNHLTENVIVAIFAVDGRVWTQLRPMSKKYYPGKWDISACGNIHSGEHRDAAARREAREELGFDVDVRYVETFLNVMPDDDGTQLRRLSHLYVGTTEAIPQPNDEVDAFKAWKPQELLIDIEARPDEYVPSFATELKLALAAASIR